MPGSVDVVWLVIGAKATEPPYQASESSPCGKRKCRDLASSKIFSTSVQNLLPARSLCFKVPEPPENDETVLCLPLFTVNPTGLDGFPPEAFCSLLRCLVGEEKP